MCNFVQFLQMDCQDGLSHVKAEVNKSRSSPGTDSQSADRHHGLHNSTEKEDHTLVSSQNIEISLNLQIFSKKKHGFRSSLWL